MTYGLSKSVIQQICEVFTQFPAVERAVLYGSRAQGTFRDSSDIDLTLFGAVLTAQILAEIEEKLDDLLLPYTFDLSIFDTIEHAKLRDHIDRIGVTFYEQQNSRPHSGDVVMEGWVTKNFEECIEKIKYTNKIPRKKFLESGTYPIVSQEQAFINGYWNEESDVLKPSRPVVIFGDHTKVLKYVDFNFVLCADGVKVLLPKDFLEPKYLFYFLHAHPLDGLGYARHYRILKELDVVYPISLSEQKQIVSILDKAFAGIDAAIANTQKNWANARELFESYLNNVFTQKGDGWVEKTLLNITTKIGSGATPRGGSKSYKTEGIPLVRSMNVYDRRFTERKLAFIDQDQADKLSNVIVQKEDVLFSITGASVARCCIAPKEYLPARVNQHVSILRPIKETVTPAFLCYLMTSKYYKDHLLGIGDEGGSTRQAITKLQLQELSISIPSAIKVQNDVVVELDILAAETQRLETIYQQKLDALAELKQSILQKAFSGELTSGEIAA